MSRRDLLAAPPNPVRWPDDPIGMWHMPAVISPNNFVNKALSSWAYNPAVGCNHGCRFCYVPSVATNKMGPRLSTHGVNDPDEQWGGYVLLREWDEAKFLPSLRKAEATADEDLKPDGNRAVMFSSTTDPYQVIRHQNPERTRELNEHAERLVRRALELIRDESTLNVRILTRSPLARRDFDLFQSLGHRLLLGVSLPTLDNTLARVYEPNAPAPTQRLQLLRGAREAGIPVYVAMAPTPPEVDEDDLRATLRAIAPLEPVTVFHEPINIRAENIERIRRHAESVGVTLNTDVFATRETWLDYSVSQLRMVERIAAEEGLAEHLHLWPDKGLGSKAAVRRQENPEEYQEWLNRWWNRISEWPGQD